MKAKTRCAWCEKDDLYRDYHDNEWGNPVYDDDKLFEFLVLETFQAGLSWYTILKKRDNFRKAFDFFDYKKIANYNENKVTALLQDAGIIRNQLKIRGTIDNAIAYAGAVAEITIERHNGTFNFKGYITNKTRINSAKVVFYFDNGTITIAIVYPDCS
jgi:DNA-3-methyladenine glycosylase I